MNSKGICTKCGMYKNERSTSAWCRDCNRVRVRIALRKKRGVKSEYVSMECPEGQICQLGQCKRIATELDHDHSTGKFRGWLCKGCNRLVGLYEYALLVGVRDYLRSGLQ